MVVHAFTYGTQETETFLCSVRELGVIVLCTIQYSWEFVQFSPAQQRQLNPNNKKESED